MRACTTSRPAALAAALAAAAPTAAAAHPFAPRAHLSVEQGPIGPAPSATSGDPGPWSPPGRPAAPDPVSAPAPAPAPATAPPVPEASPSAPEPAQATILLLPPHPLRVRAAIDGPVIALGAALAFGTGLVGRDLTWSGCGACAPSAVNALDRRVIGNENLAAAHASDALLYGAIALPFVADLADALATGRRAPGGARYAARGWARDALVLVEVLAVNVGFTNLVKFAVRRPRPYSYDPDSPLGDVTDNEARLSFYSGHASTAFAMLTAYATIFTYRHPRPRATVPVWLAAMGVATTTAVLRVVAGKHFWTDVAAGALAGAAVGVLVPTLHRDPGARKVTPGVAPAPRGGATLTLSGAF